MSSIPSKPNHSSSVPYTPLPSHSDNVVVLTYYYPPPRPNPYSLFLRRCLLFTAIILLLSAGIFLLYPSDPTIQVTRIQLNHIKVNHSPKLTLDLFFSLIVKIRNPDLFSLEYNSLTVSVGYRGRPLGFVTSHGGTLGARDSSYVNASLDLNALEVLYDAFYLIEDLARGVIPFDTDIDVKGKLGLFFFKIPIEGSVSCECLPTQETSRLFVKIVILIEVSIVCNVAGCGSKPT